MDTHIELLCAGASAVAQVFGTLTHGMVGVKLYAHFDDAWENLTPKLHMACGDVEIAAALDSENSAVIPWECLIGGERLSVGVDGWSDDGEKRIPTEWANCGFIKKSAAGEPEPAPSPDIVQQILRIARSAESNAANAVNNSGTALEQAGYAYEQAKHFEEIEQRSAENAESAKQDAQSAEAAKNEAESAMGTAVSAKNDAVAALVEITPKAGQAVQAAEEAVQALAEMEQDYPLMPVISRHMAEQTAVNHRQQLFIEALRESSEGILYTSYIDDTYELAKYAPAESLRVALLDWWGGGSIVIDGGVVHSDVHMIADKVVPDAVRSLPGYGWSAGMAFNEVHASSRSYVRKVGMVDLGTLAWIKTTNEKGTYYTSNPIPDAAAVKTGAVADILCGRYPTRSATTAAGFTRGIAYYYDEVTERGGVRIFDDELAVESLSGVLLYYRLAEPEEIDISDLLPADFDAIAVEPGGYVTFYQASPYKIDIPSRVVFFENIKPKETGMPDDVMISMLGIARHVAWATPGGKGVMRALGDCFGLDYVDIKSNCYWSIQQDTVIAVDSERLDRMASGIIDISGIVQVSLMMADGSSVKANKIFLDSNGIVKGSSLLNAPMVPDGTTSMLLNFANNTGEEPGTDITERYANRIMFMFYTTSTGATGIRKIAMLKVDVIA